MTRFSTIRQLIREVLLELYTPQKSARFYHRSYADLNVGDTLTSTTDPKSGKHWLASKAFELTMEEVRKERYPDRPSRLDCVYASLVPHSRFLSKGRLFVIEPVGGGTPFVTDSRIIDKLGNRYRATYDEWDKKYVEPFVSKYDALIEDYWEGVDPTKANLPNLEALMTEARVVEVIEEKKRPFYGDIFTLGPGVYLDAEVGVWGGKDDDDGTTKPMFLHTGDGNGKIPFEEGLAALKATKGIKIVNVKIENVESYERKIELKLEPGFTSKLTVMYSPAPGDDEDDFSSLPSFNSSFPSSLTEPSIAMRLSYDSGRRFMKLLRSGKIELSPGDYKKPKR